MTPDVTLFYGHPKGTEEPELRQQMGHLSELLSARWNRSVKLVSGKADFDRHFKRAGSWQAWIRGVVERTDSSFNPVYDGFLVPKGTMGKATAKILQHAQAKSRPIYVWDGGNLVTECRSIHLVDDDDWKKGWEVA